MTLDRIQISLHTNRKLYNKNKNDIKKATKYGTTVIKKNDLIKQPWHSNCIKCNYKRIDKTTNSYQIPHAEA